MFKKFQSTVIILAALIAIAFVVYIQTSFKHFNIKANLQTQNAVIALSGLLLLSLAITVKLDVHIFKKAKTYQPINAFIGVAVILYGLNADTLQQQPLELNIDKLYWVGAGMLIMMLGASQAQRSLLSSLRNTYISVLQPPEKTFRPEVDGLRAIAVLVVIAYHYGVKGFEGGFVGVDVFFVISGYLISGILLRELSTGTFSLTHFYERRIRRIFPALGGLLIFTLTFGLFFFDPDRLVELAKSAYSTTFFTSNFHFLGLIDYFDAPATLKPLLHTWSLAVEEQFYIFFPILFFLIWKFAKKNARLAIFITALISLIASSIVVKNNPSAAFYMFHLRAWELLAGTFITIGLTYRPVSSAVRSVVSFYGLGLILISVFTYSDKTVFPGISALLPIIGSYLFISMETGERSIAGKLLGTPPMVFIGKISYSLYLYHWTLFVFAGFLNILPLSKSQILFVTAASFILATLSWKFIETPFRSSQKWDRNNIFRFGFAYLIFFGVVASGLTLQQGFPARMPWYYSELISIFQPGPTDFETCLNNFKETTDFNGGVNKLPYIENLCILGDPNAEPSFVLWGDSHAHSMANGLDNVAKENGKSGYLLVHWGCTPLKGVDNDKREDCINYTETNLKFLKEHPEIKTVFITSMWSYNTSQSQRILTTKNKPSNSPANNDQLFKYGLEGTLRTLSNTGKEVVIVQDVPTALAKVVPAYTVSKLTGTDLNVLIGRKKENAIANFKNPNKILNEVADKFDNVTTIDPIAVFCPEDHCLVEVDGYPIYKDNHHLNWKGSNFVSVIFDDYFKSH